MVDYMASMVEYAAELLRCISKLLESAENALLEANAAYEESVKNADFMWDVWEYVTTTLAADKEKRHRARENVKSEQVKLQNARSFLEKQTAGLARAMKSALLRKQEVIDVQIFVGSQPNRRVIRRAIEALKSNRPCFEVY
jgi:hypothetical protein